MHVHISAGVPELLSELKPLDLASQIAKYLKVTLRLAGQDESRWGRWNSIA